MAQIPTFIDTSGFFSSLSKEDHSHEKTLGILSESRRRFVTTDWILGETLNLLTARKKHCLGIQFLEQVSESKILKILTIDMERFEEAKKLFIKFKDQQFPFTDCTSFVIMKEYKILDVLTADRHFKVMGFNSLIGG
jgi:predicted nucleic acid-binding protein